MYPVVFKVKGSSWLDSDHSYTFSLTILFIANTHTIGLECEVDINRCDSNREGQTGPISSQNAIDGGVVDLPISIEGLPLYGDLCESSPSPLYSDGARGG